MLMGKLHSHDILDDPSLLPVIRCTAFNSISVLTLVLILRFFIVIFVLILFGLFSTRMRH